MNYELDKFIKAFKKILNMWWLILLAALFAFVCICVLTFGETHDTYSASSHISFTSAFQYTDAKIDDVYSPNDILANHQFLENVYQALDGTVPKKKIAPLISVQSSKAAIMLTVKSTDPHICSALLSAATEEFASMFSELVKMENVKIVGMDTNAALLTRGRDERTQLRLLGAVAAALIAALVIGVMDLVSDKIDAPWMITENSKTPLLGVIPEIEKITK